jgi:excisionase family DNA binding protein
VSGFVVGPEGGVFLTGEECQHIYRLLRRVADAEERAYGVASVMTGQIVGRIELVARAYAAERKRLLSCESLDSETEVSRVDDVGEELVATSWISVPEAAEVMGVDSTYVRRLASQGRIRARQAGRGAAWMIDSASAATWVPKRVA